MTSGISALTKPAFISASETPASLHQDGPNKAGEYQNAPIACLMITAARIANQLIGNSCMTPSQCFLPERGCAAASNTGQAIIIRAYVCEPNLQSISSLVAG